MIGSIVTLVSDPSVIGAVIGISGNKYSVLVNGKVQTFYKEQIQLQECKGGTQVFISYRKSALR